MIYWAEKGEGPMNCKKLLKQAMVDCLQQKDIDAITVREILDRAEVSKQTFYRYYADKYALGNEVYDDFFSTPIYPKERITTLEEWEALYQRQFAAFRRHLPLVKHLYHSRVQGCAVEHEIALTLQFDREFLRHKGVDVEDPLIRFALEAKDVSGTYAMRRWILEGMKVPDREMVRWFRAILPQVLVEYYR